MKPIIKSSVAIIENREMSVFLYYTDCVGDILHYYLKMTQFTVLEGIQGPFYKNPFISFYLLDLSLLWKGKKKGKKRSSFFSSFHLLNKNAEEADDSLDNDLEKVGPLELDE